MASRKRALRTLRSRPQRRSLPPLLDTLEARLLLSHPGVTLPKLIFGPMPPSLGSSSGSGPHSFPTPPPKPSALLPIVIKEVPGPDGALLPDQTAGPEGYSPQQLQQAYGVNLVTFGAVKGTGAGQTIAVIDAFDNPGFVDSTAPNFKTSALGVFDSTFGLPDPPSFMKFNQNGGAALPPANSGWGPEIALDVEWAHAMAPEANIDLVEANNSSNNLSDLLLAAKTAATTLGASVVSMSFGENFESAGGGAIELAADANYFAPALAANPHVTFLASSGDNGAAPGVAPAFRIAPIYPSISPLVVAVGGTTLNLTANNQWASETGWSYNSDLFDPAGAGGGGISNTYPAPTYQTNNGVNIGGGNRTVPDVSSDADPNTGVSVYDPFDFGPSTGWVTVGGTSLSSPTWAGLIAIADQGRVLAGSTALNGPNQTLPELYSLQDYGTFFHDITQGNNGYSAGPGYDLVTGIGTPRANNLLPGLSAFGLATQGTITVQPPTSVIAGGLFGTIVEAEDSAGAPDPSVNGTATISLANGPAGASFAPVTVPVNFGVAVFDGLSLSQLSAGTDYTFHIALSAFPAQSLTTTPVDVASPATPGVGVYYPLPLDSSLRNDLTAADSNADTADDLYLVYPNTYELTNGQLLIQNTTNLPTKAISIIGQDQTSASTPLINANQASRVFDIVGTRALVTNLSVLFQGIGIEGGLGADDGGLGLAGSPAVGGGVLIDGGVVTMSNVAVKSNEVAGTKGQHGATGASHPIATAYPGGPGTAGGTAAGGGIFLAAGSLTLTGDTITGNIAQGGVGGTGGTGGLAGTITAKRALLHTETRRRRRGGAGGAGGSARRRPLRQRRDCVDHQRQHERQPCRWWCRRNWRHRRARRRDHQVPAGWRPGRSWRSRRPGEGRRHLRCPGERLRQLSPDLG